MSPSDNLEATAATFAKSPTPETFAGLAQAARDFVASEHVDARDSRAATEPSTSFFEDKSPKKSSKK